MAPQLHSQGRPLPQNLPATERHAADAYTSDVRGWSHRGLQQKQQQPQQQVAAVGAPLASNSRSNSSSGGAATGNTVEKSGGRHGGEGVTASVPAAAAADRPFVPLAMIPDVEGFRLVRHQHDYLPRCVFVLGTGRSGSTSLMDALNQLPNYLIRGEHRESIYHLFMSWRDLSFSQLKSRQFARYQEQAKAKFGERDSAWLSYDTVKAAYGEYAVQMKLPWFNDMHKVRLLEAARAYYALTYGYHGPGTTAVGWYGSDVVSGFMERRYMCGFPKGDSALREYDQFVEFVGFLRSLCRDVKLLLNSRASYKASKNMKLVGMTNASDLAKFELEMKTTHEWYDRYAQDNPKAAFRVLMEDMFHAKMNSTLAHNLLTFLGEDPAANNITFARMPTWHPETVAADMDDD